MGQLHSQNLPIHAEDHLLEAPLCLNMGYVVLK
jgi:hypothetical protein